MRQSTFYNRLLPQTVAFAKQTVPYYSRALERIDPEQITALTHLRGIPILTKGLARDAGLELLSKAVTVTYVQNTSGTTGDVLPLYRANEEIDFRARFYDELRKRYPDYGTGVRDLKLNLSLPVHGRLLPPDANDVLFLMQCAVDANSCRNSLELLRQTYPIAGYSQKIRTLSGFVRQVLIFTAYLRDQGINTADFGIKSIALSGDYVSRRIKTYLEQSWGATVQNYFGVSEIYGSATYRSYCEGFVFSPLVAPEVVDPLTLEPIDEGEGLLLLTTLYPFVQAQPFIRYKTGDIVRKQSFHGVENFTFLGREQHCLRNPFRSTYELLLSGTGVYEAFDSKPYVRKVGASYGVALNDISPLARPVLLGSSWKSGSNGFRCAVFVEANEDPIANPAVFRLYARTLRDELLASSQRFRRLVDSQSFNLQIYFLRPQHLTRHFPAAMGKTDVGWTNDLTRVKMLGIDSSNCVGSNDLSVEEMIENA